MKTPPLATHAARPRLTSRQEAVCEAMSFNVGGAEAARQAGYSANGVKQRGAFLMHQPEIRVRVYEIRTARPLALRAIEFRLKLRGMIQDKHIAHHHHGTLNTHPHPDADLESLPGDPEEDLDPIRFRPGYVPEPKSEIPPETETDDDLITQIVTYDDLSGDFARVSAHFGSSSRPDTPDHHQARKAADHFSELGALDQG